MTKSDSGVMNIKKKVANLKQELDEANDRANGSEATLREKEVVIDKVSAALPGMIPSFEFFPDIFFSTKFLCCAIYSYVLTQASNSLEPHTVYNIDN